MPHLSVSLARSLLRAVAVAAAVGLAVSAGAQWSARRAVQVGKSLRAGHIQATLGANSLSHAQGLNIAASILEGAVRRWPPCTEASLERAHLAVVAGDCETADVWLERSRGRVASRLRWSLLAAQVCWQLDRAEEAERHLSEALALNPCSADPTWEDLAVLRERIGCDPQAVSAARMRGAMCN